MADDNCDVAIVGAGFGAIATLHLLRQQGLKVKIFEKGSRSGGIWYWNCYPGARVDSDAPIYQMFDKELWEGFSFKERYPGWQELRRYFDYLDEKLQFSKSVEYDSQVTGATFDDSKRLWHIKCGNGKTATAKWFIPAIGFAAKKYVPPIQGLDKFKGPIHHTAEWPQQGVDLVGKRIAVIGTGASGVQVIQESGHEAKQLTVYQRTPNFALPMNQKPLIYDENEQLKREGKFDEAFKTCYTTFAGFSYDFNEKNTFDDSPEDREKFYRKLLIEEGGFRYWLNTYKDMLFDEKANMEAYNFWRDFVRSRVKDERHKEILAPTKPPHPWGTKRPSLEQYYYEIYNLPHVDLVDLSEDPIEEITETGIKNKSGKQTEFDVIALATGFDAVTGSLAQLDIRAPASNQTIADHWKEGLKTSMGISINGFPNMFFLYGPQAPTAFSNGPSCVQIQAQWIAKTIKQLNEQGVDRLEATEAHEKEWTDKTHHAWDITLFPQAKSWYQGANIPGRKVEPLNWAGGIPAYIQALDESRDNDWQGWRTAKAVAA
ncbi:MAG: hypothetical protein M1828_007102 [Chrysothrix sp. TS-e1954]|nr:MAG: hypothetical protein M1828_007102 [Chrysothrix sp. TS-e1954]